MSRWPCDLDAAKTECENGIVTLKSVTEVLQDSDLHDITLLLETYCSTNFQEQSTDTDFQEQSTDLV